MKRDLSKLRSKSIAGVQLVKKVFGDVASDDPTASMELPELLGRAFGLYSGPVGPMSPVDTVCNAQVYDAMNVAINTPTPELGPDTPVKAKDYSIRVFHAKTYLSDGRGNNKILPSESKFDTVTIRRSTLNALDVGSLLGLGIGVVPSKPDKDEAMYAYIAYQLHRNLGSGNTEALMMAMWVHVIWNRESGFKWTAVSPDGDARGAGQFRVSTWNGLEDERQSLRVRILNSPNLKEMFAAIPPSWIGSAFATPANQLMIWGRKVNTIMTPAATLKAQGHTPLQNVVAKMHPMDQLITFVLLTRQNLLTFKKYWSWSDTDHRWKPNNPKTSLEFAAVYLPAMFDFAAGFMMISKVSYGDGPAYMNREWIVNQKILKNGTFTYGPKILNHLYPDAGTKGVDRYAMAARDILYYLQNYPDDLAVFRSYIATEVED